MGPILNLITNPTFTKGMGYAYPEGGESMSSLNDDLSEELKKDPRRKGGQ
jgi:hypothetical protein